METDVNKTIRKTKNRWEDDIRNDMKKMKIKNWTSCIQDRSKWKLYVEKAKHSIIEVVAPKEEKEEEYCRAIACSHL